MSNFFQLELDTTPPDIELIAPSYTVPYIYTEIIVKANEQLAEWQEIYIVDSNGKRHDVIFSYEGNQYIGLFDFANCSLGIATIYATVRDDVLNLSELATASINVKQTAKLTVKVNDTTRTIALSETPRKVSLNEMKRNLNFEEQTRLINDAMKTRNVEVMIDELSAW